MWLRRQETKQTPAEFFGAVNVKTSFNRGPSSWVTSQLSTVPYKPIVENMGYLLTDRYRRARMARQMVSDVAGISI